MDAPVLLLHGLGGTRHFWEDVEPLLPGDVRSLDLPAGPIATKAQAILGSLSVPHLVIGHSLGGMVAQEMALAAPELVSALVLANTIPGASARVVRLNSATAELVERQGSSAMADQVIPALFGPEDLEGTVRAKARLRTDMSATPPQRLAADLRAICGFDARDRLAGCRVPAMVVGGEHEPNLADQRLLAELLGTELVVLSGTGHMSPGEAPGAFVDACRPLLLP